MRLDGANCAYRIFRFGSNHGAETNFRTLKCIFLESAAISMVNFSIPGSLNSLDNILYIINNALSPWKMV